MSFIYLCMIQLLWALPLAEDVLKKVDANMNYASRTANITMAINKGRRIKSYKMRSHARGKYEAAIEFKAPARDKGTKMLKKKDELWMYMPSIEKTQKISGHMLRQGMMGSDMSYEDLLETTQLLALYEAKVVGEESMNGRQCYKLELKAKNNTITYTKRISWIDKENMVPVKELLFSLSGMLVKEWTMSGVQTFDGRKFPTKIVVVDKLKNKSSTTLEFTKLEFKVSLADEIFSKRWLER